jgi:PTS system mannose-specific IIC component
MDPAFAGTVGTALALATGASATVATSLAVPIGLLGTVIWILHMTVDITFVHMADRAAEEGDIDKINRVSIIYPQVFLVLISVIPVALAVYYGTGVVQTVLSLLEGRPLEVMSLIGGLLPALGIAMNLRAMSGPGLLVFFVFGFLLTVYSGLPILAVSIFAGIFAYIYTKLTYASENGGQTT